MSLHAALNMSRLSRSTVIRQVGQDKVQTFCMYDVLVQPD